MFKNRRTVSKLIGGIILYKLITLVVAAAMAWSIVSNAAVRPGPAWFFAILYIVVFVFIEFPFREELERQGITEEADTEPVVTQDWGK